MLRSNPARVALACVATLVALAVTPAGAQESRGSVFGTSSMAGSGKASMQLETVPARVARVVVRPGSGGSEAWALGTTTARMPGYSTESIGQVVFLKYTPATGWVIAGPPRNAEGKIINPVLSWFDLRADGEGWAVGDRGALLRKKAGSDAWVQAPQSGSVTQQTLTSVSLAPTGGYAVGVGPTVLRLSGSTWAVDPVPSEMSAQTSDLLAVAAVSGADAWAVATGQVSGVDSTSLLIYRRSVAGWARVTTGQAIFDSPPAKSRDGAINRSVEAGAIAADAKGAWIGGRLYPRTPSAPEGDASIGDTSRAFVIRYDNASQAFTSYCPDAYGDRSGSLDLSRMCDQPFPTAPFHVASLSISPQGDVFAGGVGLFRFSGKGWYREPNANGYLISISMGSNTEGFVASSGRSLGAGGLIRSSTNTIGHWTAKPKRSAIARWSQPQDQLLEDVAVAPDGTGRAIAVGALSAGSLFSGAAWDSINPVIGYNLHGVAWPAGARPWAVGSAGFILRLDGNEWNVVESPTRRTLFSVAFRNAGEGVAVGLGGTILVYQNGRWRDDSPPRISNDLYSVIVTPSGYLATGTDGAVVEGTPGAWRLRPEGRTLLKRAEAPQAPTLYSATVLGDRVIIGGQDSALLERRADGTLANFEAPLQGTILSLSAAGGVLHASLTPGPQKFRGEAPAAQRGTVMRYADGRWSDIGLQRRSTLLRDQVDPAAFEDPIYDLEMISATQGWGVGGSPADLKDPVDGQFRSQSTSAVYRIDSAGDPSQKATRAKLDLPAGGIPFAAFGESWCGRGLCSSAVGTGIMADEVSLQIREEINEASQVPGGPKFVIFTGNMRRTGIPEELEQFKSYLRGFRIPVFVAPGTLDRFTASDPTQAATAAASSAGGSNDYWKATFAAQPAPWGHDKPLSNFAPAGVDTAETVPGSARTHYAFDYLAGGRRAVRFVFIDSSTRSYGTLQQQNPPQDQSTWLATVLAEATDVLGIPTVVVTNQPPFLPSDEQIPNWSVFNDQQHFESTVAAARVSAVITGGPRVNAIDMIKGTVPMHVVGGGGGPLGRDLQVQGSSTAIEPASKLPTDGYYHAWHLMRLDPSERNPLTGQVRVHDDAFPVLESLAMHSFFGARIPAGTTTSVTALARGLAGGFSDPDQAKSQYLAHGFQRFRCAYKGQGNGVCISASAKLPRFRFYSEDPSIASFVVRDPLDATAPRKIGGEIVQDETGADGLLCVYRLGKVGIVAEAGMHKTRIEIEGIPGNGPCVEQEVKGVKVVDPPVIPAPPVEPVAKENFFFRTAPRQDLTVVFPPPPAPVVAPAPPGAPGVGSKEEHEVEFETESHDDGKNSFRAHQFTAINQQRRQQVADETQAWMMLAGVTLLSFFGAAALAAVRERRRPDHSWSKEAR